MELQHLPCATGPLCTVNIGTVYKPKHRGFHAIGSTAGKYFDQSNQIELRVNFWQFIHLQ